MGPLSKSNSLKVTLRFPKDASPVISGKKNDAFIRRKEAALT